MKRFFKYFLSTFLVIIIFLGLIFRGRISLYLNIGKKYTELLDNLSSVESVESLNNIALINSTEYEEVTYKNTNNKPLNLNIFSPKKYLKNGSPVIMYIHGGSWAYGNRDIPQVLSPLLDAFREEGYTIISVSYELLSNSIDFDKQISDVKDAIRWVNKNKNEYKFNTDEIGLIGISAGAHLALMAAYSDETEFTDSLELANYSSKSKYVLDFFGPTDLSTLDTSDVDYKLSKILSKIENKKDIIEKCSPINYIKKDLPKTMIVHSKSDTLVPYKNSEDLYFKSKELGNTVELVTVEDLNHDLSNINKDAAQKIAINVLKFVVNNSPI